MFHKNIMKISEKKGELVENLPLSYLLYRILHNGKKWKYLIFLKTNDSKKNFVHR